MKVQQLVWTRDGGWPQPLEIPIVPGASLLFVFGDRASLTTAHATGALGALAPAAVMAGCSTAGQIAGGAIEDDCLVATLVTFDRTRVSSATVKATAATSREAGRELAQRLQGPDLAHVFVFCEGLDINGTELVRGLSEGLPEGVSVTGGLAADGDRFEQTAIACSGNLCSNSAIGVGLYSRELRVGYGSFGGWDPFGPERLVTRADHNVLYELDGQSALELYRRYLGEHAQRLPASGLLFPLSLRVDDGPAVVRTILSVDESQQSMTFAGDIPVGGYARLMKANFDRLIDGAAEAGRISSERLAGSRPDFALLISCVGRRMVLRQRAEEEIEAVSEVLGHPASLTGFYSYGEVSPFSASGRCALHNQTMTVTTLTERA